MKNFFYFFTFSMLFASCDIVVDLDIPEHERVLVVTSILTTDSMINASISHSVGAFDASSISYVNNAIVEVYEDGVLLGEMNEEVSFSSYMDELDSTYAYNFNQNPVAGKIYSYEIAHSDYEAVRAETTVPAAVKLNVNDVTLLSEQDDEKHYRVRFSFNDAPEDNFYRLRFRYQNEYYDGFNDFESNDASMISTADVQSDGATFYGDESLFDDEMFNGTEKEISIDFFVYNKPLEYTLELTSVSESYYTYIRSLRAHYDNQDQFIFAGEPVQVFTNIENGLGVLGSMSVDTMLLELP